MNVMNVQSVQYAQQRKQNINFGMTAKTEQVVGRKAKGVACEIASLLDPVPSDAIAILSGENMIKVAIVKAGRGLRTVDLKVSDANKKSIENLVRKVRATLCMQ